MALYSVADAKNNLPKLIDRALNGEEVTITRRGKVVAHLTGSAPKSASGPKGTYDVEWLRANLVTPKGPPIDIMQALRDDERY